MSGNLRYDPVVVLEGLSRNFLIDYGNFGLIAQQRVLHKGTQQFFCRAIHIGSCAMLLVRRYLDLLGQSNANKAVAECIG